MNTQKGPYPIFTFYITSCRNVMPPGVYRQIFSNKKMSPPPPGVPYAYYDENREPCADFQRAIYVVHDSALPTPPGFSRLNPGVNDLGMPLSLPTYSCPEDEMAATVAAIGKLLRHHANEPLDECSVQAKEQRTAVNSDLVGVPPPPPQTQQKENGEVRDEEVGYQLQLGQDGYYLKPLKSGRALRTTNFLIELQEVRHRITPEGEKEIDHQRLIFRVHLLGSGKTVDLEIDIAQLGKIVDFVRQRVPESTVFHYRTVFPEQLDILLRTQFAQCKHAYEYGACGWMQIPCHGMAYVHDDIPAPSETIFFKSGFAFGRGPQQRNVPEIIEAGFGVLGVSNDLMQSAILFLWAHLGLMWTLFAQAGYPPRALLYLSGVSGSLKTAVCKTLFNFTAVPELDIPASFRDTSASMEISIDQYKDRVLLVDDFCPAANKAARRTMEQTLESLIRFYGDGNTKGRADPRMDKVYMKKARGLCVITGEDVAGSLSSRLRCLFLHVEKTSFRGDILKQYQEMPYLWTEYLSCFVDALPTVIPNVVERIQSSFPQYRVHAEEVLQERRLIDTYCWLAVTARLTLEVASKLSGADLLGQWLEPLEQAALTACVSSEQQSTQQLPERLFAETLMTLIQRQDVRLGTKEEFVENPQSYLGVIQSGYWYLWPQETYLKVVEYYNAGGGHFPLSQSALWEALANAGILLRPVTKRNGQLHYENGTKVSFAGRPRLLKIDPAKLRELAEAE